MKIILTAALALFFSNLALGSFVENALIATNGHYVLQAALALAGLAVDGIILIALGFRYRLRKLRRTNGRNSPKRDAV